MDLEAGFFAMSVADLVDGGVSAGCVGRIEGVVRVSPRRGFLNSGFATCSLEMWRMYDLWIVDV